MGSSIGSTSWALAAVLFGALYLLFDAARFFIQRLGSVRLRRWSAEPAIERGGKWFEYDPEQFSLISGTLIQVSLVGAIGCTVVALRMDSVAIRMLIAAAIWCGVIVLWKFAVVLLPENLAEEIVKDVIAISHFFYYLFWPLLFPVRWTMQKVERDRDAADDEEDVTEEELQAYIDVGEEEGILEEDDAKLVQSIVDFGDRIAREVMTPRVDVQGFEVTGTVEELAALFSESKYSRIPVFEGNIDRIVGVVHVKDLFDVLLKGEHPSILDISRPAYFVSGTKNVAALLREFQIEHLHMGVVVDEYGGTAGVVSIEDLVEEIVGEIADEHEEDEESIVELEDGLYLVNGMTRVETLEEMFGVELEEEGYETVAGLIFTAMGRVPRSAEVITKNGLSFEVERADRKRIYRVRVRREVEVSARPSGNGS
jgi:CBS domain containing-hemolysin-like protein